MEGRFFHRKVARLQRHILLLHSDEFGQGADAEIGRAGVHFVAYFETTYLAAHFHHHARHIVAQNQRQLVRQDELEFAAFYFSVQLIQTGRIHLHHYFVRLHDRLRHFAGLQRFVFTVLLNKEGLHLQNIKTVLWI